MGLGIGTSQLENIIEGMTQSVYEKLDEALSGPFKDVINNAQDSDAVRKAQDTLDEARKGWENLAEVISSGIVEYANSHITIKAKQNTVASILHTHDVSITVE